MDSKQALMRPTYETPSDTERERNTAERVATAWGYDVRKLKAFYAYDYALFSGETLEAFVEIKVRTRTFETYWLLLAKWSAMNSLIQTAHVPGLFVVAWPGRTMFTTVSNRPLRVLLGGRTDRGDASDIEPLVEIPLIQFKDV